MPDCRRPFPGVATAGVADGYRAGGEGAALDARLLRLLTRVGFPRDGGG